MYIYKITVIPINQIYIGLDTKPAYKQARWKEHCRTAFNSDKKRKIHNAMREHGIENCLYEIVEDGFQTIGQLALAEIAYIKKFNSYQNGLNSTPGGDGLGEANLLELSESEIIEIRHSLGNSFTEYNKKKWIDTTPEQRKEMVKNAFTPEVNARRRHSLKQYYNSTPGARTSKANAITRWQTENRETLLKNNRKNSLIGAAKTSKKLLVEFPDGSMLYYPSKSDFHRQTGQWPKTILQKTAQGLSHNGYKAWEQ
jgi:hypothetical protein